MTNFLYSTMVVLLLFVTASALDVPQIKYVSSARGKGLVLTNIPNDVKMSVRKNGDIVLLTFVSPSFNHASPISYSSQSLTNDEVSNIAARIVNGKLEVVFSTTKVSLFSSVSFKAVSGQKKGMVLLSSQPSTNNEILLVAKNAPAPVAKSMTAPVAKNASAPVAKSTTAPVAKSTTAPVAKSTTAPVAKSTTAPVAKSTTAPVAKSTILYFVQDDVTVRDIPSAGASSKVIGKYPKGTRFESSEKSGEYYKIILKNGKTGWVHSVVAKDSLTITPAQWDSIHAKKSSQKPYAVSSQTPSKVKQSSDAFAIETSPKNEAPQALRQSTTNTVIQDTTQIQKKSFAQYTPQGRDPFIPLEKAGELYKDKDDELPRLDSIELVGVLYDASNAIALFEEKAKNGPSVSFTLMKGDLIKNGKVHQIFPEKVVFLMQEYNYTYTVEKILRRQKK